MPTFDETMEDSRIRLSFTLAMKMMGKAARILAERGADTNALSFVTTGTQIIINQVREYPDRDQKVSDEMLDSLSQLIEVMNTEGVALSSKFDETMGNDRVFLTYSLAMTAIGKAAQTLAERGAKPKAMSFITTGIELLAKQLRDYADAEDLKEGAETEIAKMRKLFDIAPADSNDTGQAEDLGL
jgi:hypothetical protein